MLELDDTRNTVIGCPNICSFLEGLGQERPP